MCLCFAALFCCPWIGFAIEGRVVEAGLAKGSALGAIPLAGLVGLAVAQRMAWARLAPEIRREWREGRVIPAAGAPRVQLPARFVHRLKRIEIDSQALVVSRQAVLRSRGVADVERALWMRVEDWVVPWSEIVEWIVHTDMDDADFYRIRLRSGGYIDVSRAPAQGAEPALLDALRCAGSCPIRLLCDVD